VPKEACVTLDAGAYLRHLANTIEPSMRGGDAALCQVTLTTGFYFITQGPDFQEILVYVFRLS